MNSQIREELLKILGEDAFSIGSMQVSERVQKLVKSVNYLVTQLYVINGLLKDVVEDDSDTMELREHIDMVVANVKAMLN